MRTSVAVGLLALAWGGAAASGANKRVLGIDLGTKMSVVAFAKLDPISGTIQPETIINGEGSRTTPSVVTFEEDRLEVGEGALERLLEPSNLTLFDVKRVIGRPMSQVKAGSGLADGMIPCNAARHDGDNTTVIGDMAETEAQALAGERQDLAAHGKCKAPSTALAAFKDQACISYHGDLVPVIIASAAVLRDLRVSAQNHLEEHVTDAVITIPAHFTNEQRQATMLAARIAGLNVMRLVPEPTAAAIAFGLMPEAAAAEENVVVFDFGGGTLDVSCMRRESSGIIIKAVAGDPFLGGADVDKLLASLLYRRFAEQGGSISESNRSRVKAMFESEAREVKHRLSNAHRMKVVIHGILRGGAFETVVLRRDLELAMRELLDKAHRVVENALTKAKWGPDDVDRVLLVGGSSRIPAVQTMLSTFLGGELSKVLNPDEAIAAGAAIWAAKLANPDSPAWARAGANTISDVTPAGIGIAVRSDSCRAAPEGTSEITRRVLEAGGSDGELRFSLSWASRTDLDLAVLDTKGTMISFSNKSPVSSKGVLDVDMNVVRGLASDSPVENIVWKKGTSPPDGQYTVVVTNFSPRGAFSEPFTLEIRQGDDVSTVQGSVAHRSPFKHRIVFEKSQHRTASQDPDAACELEMQELLPANTRVPTSLASRYTVRTARRGQTDARIKVIEGDNRLASENSVLGELAVTGIVPVAGGQGELEVAFGIDDNGFLTVRAADTAGSSGESVLLQTTTANVDSASIDALQAFLECLAEDDTHDEL